MKKYQIIYADPPWEYKNKRIGIVNGDRSLTNNNGRTPFPMLELEQIKALNVLSIADNDSALFLWVTNPYLEKGFQVINSWGFTYKGVAFFWLKTYQASKPKSLEFYMNSCYGINYYTKLNVELCLLGMRGSVKPVSHRVSGQIMYPRQKHSQKPDEARNRIVKLFGNLPRIELFARQRVEGWDCWGNEVEGDIKL